MSQPTHIIDEYVPARTPTQVAILLSGTAIDLGGVSGSSARSHSGFELWSASAWYVGDSAAQVRLVAANEPYALPSSSLSGWWAKSTGGSISLVATAANKAS